jgi:hypothetical protein
MRESESAAFDALAAVWPRTTAYASAACCISKRRPFVSGPAATGLSARLAVKILDGGAWQESYTRPGETLGGPRVFVARVLLDWNPNDALKVEFNAKGWLDKSAMRSIPIDVDFDYVICSPTTRRANRRWRRIVERVV